VAANPNYQKWVQSLVTHQAVPRGTTVSTKKPSAPFQAVKKTYVPKPTGPVSYLNAKPTKSALIGSAVWNPPAPDVGGYLKTSRTFINPATIPTKLFIDTFYGIVPGSKPDSFLVKSAPFSVRERTDFLSQVGASKTYVPRGGGLIEKKSLEGAYPSNIQTSTSYYYTYNPPSAPLDLFKYVDWKTVLIIGGGILAYVLFKNSKAPNISLHAV